MKKSVMNIKSPINYLFGTEKLRMIKFFYTNPNKFYTAQELADELGYDSKFITKELRTGIAHNIFEVEKRKGKNPDGYRLKTEMNIFKAIEPLIFDISVELIDVIKDKITGVGTVKVCVLCGKFAQKEHDRVDMFLVADKMNDRKLETFLSSLEAEIGSEIRYTTLTKEEFEYRKNMFDKFVWSIIEDSTNIVLIDKIKLYENKS